MTTSKGRVLLVDDEPEVLELFEEIVRRQGYEVRTVSAGVVSRLMRKIENAASGCLRLVESSPSALAANAQHQPRAKRVGCMLKVRRSERKRTARCAR
jgi:CheY-like chemotaxis protein